MPPISTGGALVAGRDEPGAPRWEVADLFRLYGEAYRHAHPVPSSHQKGMHDSAVWRTAQRGGPAARCPQCGLERYAYHSCRHRHCPTCQTLTKAQWLEDRQAALLPVPYFHLVFPLPHELNLLILAHQRPL